MAFTFGGSKPAAPSFGASAGAAPVVIIADRMVDNGKEPAASISEAPFYEGPAGEDRGKMVCALRLHNKEAEPVCFQVLSNAKTLCARPPRRIPIRIFQKFKTSCCKLDRCPAAQQLT
jgi:hypothetical protein